MPQHLAQSQENKCDQSKVSKNKQLWSVLTCPKSAKWLSVFELLKVDKMTILKTYTSLVVEKLEISNLDRR